MSRFGSDEEEVQIIKNWWKANGSSLTTTILIAAIAWAGWTYWQNNKMETSTIASATFENLQQAMSVGKFGDVSREALRLMEDQPDSPYSTAAGLMMAKFKFDKGEMNEALEHLEWVEINAPNASFKRIAVLRAVNILVEQNEFTKAKEKLDNILKNDLVASEQANIDYAYADLFLKQKNIDKAKQYLQQVVDNTATQSGLLQLAKIQLDDLS